jgi:glycosyltransferase involved in cell wall biosynthesis
MNLHVPLFCLRHGTVSAGLESAVLNLVAGLARIGATVTLPIATVSRLPPDFLAWVGQQRSVSFKSYPMISGGTWTRFVEETIFLNSAPPAGPILFPNYFLPPSISGRARSAFVFIHDCQHRVFPQFFSARKRRWLDWEFKRTLKKAAHVLLISEFERSQIARFYGDRAAARCTVAHNAIDWSRYSDGPVSAAIASIAKHRYILSVSHQYAHKRTETIIDAFVQIAGANPDLCLVLAGKESAAVRSRINAVGNIAVRDRIMSTHFVSDVELGRLYENCQLFVLASEYEGFGMPAVEAMGFGVPVLVTNGSSLPEVTLGKATYVEPGSPAGVWADAIAQQLARPRDDAALQGAATAVRQRFAPELVARTVVDCIDRYGGFRC